MLMMNNKKVRLSMDIDAELHKQIKYFAIMRNITLTEWVIKAIARLILEETKYD